jgi:hypothetical protein
MRSYRTDSGTFSEDDLCVVVWRNPKNRSSRQSRYLETMTSETSRLPMMFPIAALKSDRAWAKASIPRTMNELFEDIERSGPEAPVIVRIPLARSVLGWEDFHIPTEFTFNGSKKS